jgi:hypothetical protein
MGAMLTEQTHLVKGLDPVADAFAGTVYSDVVNMSRFHKVRFIIYCGVGTTGTSTLTVEACDDTTPSNTSAITFYYRQILSGDTPGTLTAAATTGFTTTAGSSKIIVVEADAAQLAASGYGYIRLKAVESVDAAVLGGILIELYEPKYGVDTSTRATT